MKKLGILFALAYLTAPGVAHAATFYVSKAGNNGYSCAQAQSISTPKLTVTAGLSCVGSGDTLYVRAGTYNEDINNNVASGTSGAYTRVAAYPGETVWMTQTSANNRMITFGGGAGISPAYIEFDGINFNGSASVYGAVLFDAYQGANPNHIRIKNAEFIEGPNHASAGTFVIASNDNEFLNLTVHGGGTGPCGNAPCSNYAFYIAGARNVIDGCDIYDTSLAGVQFYSSGGTPTDNVLRNSRIHDITRTPAGYGFVGVIVAGNNTQVYNNIIQTVGATFTGGDAAINVYAGSGNKIYNNTIYNNRANAIKVDAAAANTVIRNNILRSNESNTPIDNGAGSTIDHNLNGTDPQFVNPAANDFRLKAGSAAIDAGMSASVVSVVSRDMAGVARPQGASIDIGAFEYSAQGSASGTPPPGPPAAPQGLRFLSN